jgi:hypothetical protein
LILDLGRAQRIPTGRPKERNSDQHNQRWAGDPAQTAMPARLMKEIGQPEHKRYTSTVRAARDGEGGAITPGSGRDTGR